MEARPLVRAEWLERAGRRPLHRVVQLDPRRDAAWRRLGYKKIGQRWIDPAKLAAAKSELELQKQADKHWKPLLESYRNALRTDKTSKKADAEQALRDINDRRAVPAVLAVFAGDDPRMQRIAVEVLGRVDSLQASQALALLSIFSNHGDVRGQATSTLRGRDPREYASLLIGLLRKPVKFQTKPVGGPGVSGSILFEGENANVQRQYTPPPPVTFIEPLGHSPEWSDFFTVDPRAIQSWLVVAPAPVAIYCRMAPTHCLGIRGSAAWILSPRAMRHTPRPLKSLVNLPRIPRRRPRSLPPTREEREIPAEPFT